MDDGFVRNFLSEFDDSRFPEDFLADYEAMECLAHNDAGETLLVRARKTGAFFVAKCYEDASLLSQATESDLLRNLRHRGLPAFTGEYRGGGMLCVVREYVEGTPLDQVAAGSRLTLAQVVSLGTQLCDILTYLHSKTPPVIHRDIKPQNIIMDGAGSIRLIDFGISRVYDEGAREDTVRFGTRHFAAPEQYGFAQTDPRADIFSLGVLLGWLITGESDARDILPKIENRRLRRIVKKCTAFAPEGRYPTAARVKAALLAADGRKARRALARAGAAVACAAFLCVGFALGRYTDLAPAFLAPGGVVFQEPLVEQAVRLALQKGEGEPIAEADLLNVTELYIYGDQAAASQESYDELALHMAENDGVVRNGGMRSLADVARLANLRRLSVALENISDLSPLSQMTSLEQVDLRHNPVEDVSPLAGLVRLRDVCLFGTNAADLTPLSTCPQLDNVNAGGTRVASPEAFAGLLALKSLHLSRVTLVTLSGVEALSRLENIGLEGIADGDLTPLLSLPRLKAAYLAEDLREAAEADLSQAGFEIIYS